MKVFAAVVLLLVSASCRGYEDHVAPEISPFEAWGLEENDPWDSLREFGAEVHRAFKHAMGSGEISNEISEGIDTAMRFGMSLLNEVKDSGEGVWEQVSEEAEKLAFQLEEEMIRRAEAIESHAEAYAQEVRRNIDQNLLEIQKNTMPMVQTFQGQLAQTVLNIRKSTESFFGGFASLWETNLTED